MNSPPNVEWCFLGNVHYWWCGGQGINLVDPGQCLEEGRFVKLGAFAKVWLCSNVGWLTVFQGCFVLTSTSGFVGSYAWRSKI